MAIVKQVDAAYEGDPSVAFIESAPKYVKGPNVWDECVSGETYRAELHRRPITQRGFVCSCGHEHREIDPAVRCAKRLLKRARKERL